MKKSFSKKANVSHNQEVVEEKKTGFNFIRSKQDNELLKEIQLKDDFFEWVDPEATVICDADGIPFNCASSVEENYVTVKLLKKEEGVDEKGVFPEEQEYSNKSVFKGRTRGDKIGAGSPLADKNLQREIMGLEPYTLSDFEIIPEKRLKYEKGTTIDNIKFANSFEVCKYFIDNWFEAILIQTQLKKIRPVIGGGETTRHSILVPHQYKSGRSDTKRPILLSEARKYVEEKYNTIIAPPLIEADEVVDAMAARAYDHAMQTGTKIKMIKSAQDKDAHNKRGVLQDWSKSLHFKYPQCWLIHSEDRDVGHLQLIKGKIKGSGLKFFCYQVLMEDTADEYSPRKYLPEEYKDCGKGFGDTAFFKLFEPLTTPKDVLQTLVDKYYEWFDKGLRYIAWDGTEVHEDTLSYLEKHFSLAYMREGKDDKTVIRDWFDKYEVDYSKLVDNHIEKPKLLAPEGTVREVYSKVTEQLESISEVLSQQKGTKPVLVENMQKAGELVSNIVEEMQGLFIESDKPVNTSKKRSLQEVIDEYNKEHGYESSSENDYEVFIECLSNSVVREETSSNHRWFDIMDVVHKVIIDDEERFFSTFDYHITGDNSASDMDLDMPTLEDVYEVFPSQVVTTVYK